MSMAKYGDPAVHPAPIKENKAETVSAFLRPIQSASQPCAMDPSAAPNAKRAFTAPRTLRYVNNLSTSEGIRSHLAV